MATISSAHNHKRRAGFIKTKLASFSRAAKPFLQANNIPKVKPDSHSVEILTTKHNYLNRSSLSTTHRGLPSTGTWQDPVVHGQQGSYYCYGVGVGNGDENVDMKAASYISNVRERFKKERFDMDHPNTKCQEIH